MGMPGYMYIDYGPSTDIRANWTSHKLEYSHSTRDTHTYSRGPYMKHMQVYYTTHKSLAWTHQVTCGLYCMCMCTVNQSQVTYTFVSYHLHVYRALQVT